MTGFIPKEKLTAYQRWELAAFDEAEEKKTGAPADTTPEPPPPADPVPEPPMEPPAPMPALPTVEEIERIHTEAHESGYAAGYEEGAARARSEAETIGGLLENLHTSLQGLEQSIAEQLLALSVEIAGQILRQSLRIKPELILPVVREAVSALPPHQGHPILLVHPDDATLIRTHLGEQLAHNSWRIIEDTTLTAGGCRVELASSEVDATLETRWRRVVEALGSSREWLDMPPAP